MTPSRAARIAPDDGAALNAALLPVNQKRSSMRHQSRVSIAAGHGCNGTRGRANVAATVVRDNPLVDTQGALLREATARHLPGWRLSEAESRLASNISMLGLA